MQAALHGGAATSRPSIACVWARGLRLWTRSWAIAGAASDATSNSAVKICGIFIVRLLCWWISTSVHGDQQPRQTLLIFRSTYASSGSRLCWDEEDDAGISAVRGLRLPPAAYH